MSRLSLFVLLSLIVCVSADTDVREYVLKLQPFVLKSSSYCPVPIIGHACPAANELYYFSCCGELHKDCCGQAQDWVITLLILSVALLVVLLCAPILCCCCVRKE